MKSLWNPYENPYEVILIFTMEMYTKLFKNNFCYEIHTFNIGKSFYIAKPLFETVCMFPDLLWYTNISLTLWILVDSFYTLGYWLALSNLLDTNLIFVTFDISPCPFRVLRYLLALSKLLDTGRPFATFWILLALL